MMVERPQVRRRDYLTAGSVALLLLVAYVVYPDPLVQYGVWLVVFAIWMGWFVSFGVDWLYPDTADDRDRA
jgi:hypothetical protein